jgi:aquaporin Z
MKQCGSFLCHFINALASDAQVQRFVNINPIPNAGAGITSTAVAPSQSRPQPVAPPVGAVASFRAHWMEYTIEASLLGAFMISACAFGVLLEYPGSPVRHAIDSATLRRFLMGLAMGSTAIGLIYSPWGKQSGAHFNPATTLTFLRLGKIKGWDALFYIVFQFVGGLAGVLLVSSVIGAPVADAHVRYVVTVGQYGPAVAFASELLITFFLMSTVLVFISRERLARATGIAAGILVAAYIALEAPYSGMSMNPARTLASAVPAQLWESVWIYFTAPPLGMLAAAQFHLWRNGRHAGCAKLHHDNSKRCIFCGANGGFEA